MTVAGRLRAAVAAFRGERRANDQRPDVSAWTGNMGGGRRWITQHTAENLSTVLACVTVIATAAASLPAYVYRRAERGRAVDEGHPLARLIAEGPNDKQTWPDWLEWTLAQALLRGNSLSEIVRDPAGRVVALEPIPWENVAVQLLPTGRLAYDVVRITDAWGGSGRPRRLLDGEVFHLRDRSDDGMVGRSRLSRAPAVIEGGLSVQEFAGAMYHNGATPRGVLTFANKLSLDQLKLVRDMWTGLFTGPDNAAKTLILDQGGEFKPMSVSPEDAELLASRRFTVEELARLFNVPPPLIQDYSRNTFTNSEQAGRWFAQFTLAPWLRKIEAETSRSVLGIEDRATHHLEIDLSGMTRGDYTARWAAHKVAVDADILSRDEVREIEGFNPRPAAGGAPAQGGPIVA